MNHKRHNLPLIIMLCIFILGVGCTREDIKAVRDLFPLRSAIISEFKERSVEVKIQNGNTLGITFVNPQFNYWDSKEQERKASEIADFVINKYKSIGRIDTIWISFTIYKKYFFIFHYTNALNTFFFKKNESGDYELYRKPS